MNEFCIDGKVDWKKLVKFNSAKEKFEGGFTEKLYQVHQQAKRKLQ
jgi:hypothetical protein